jgi:seryl-tRNA synthetase
MAAPRATTSEHAEFLRELLTHRLLVGSGVPGVYGRGAAFEAVLEGLDRAIDRTAAPDEAESLRFPPILPRRHIESSGYLESFPHLAGVVFAFEGTEADATRQHERASRHEDWSEFQRMTDVMLAPAVCYPVYPAVAGWGPLPPGGRTIDVGAGYAFRNEPSDDAARMQAFHIRELVRIGEPDVVSAWRGSWRDRSIEFLRGLGLQADFDVAADPFFGRAGRLLAASQREQALKFEILVPVRGPEPTAVASFNYHRDHFASTYGITTADGAVAHTACLGFGLERVVLALLAEHGYAIEDWPAEVRRELELG